MYSAEQCLKQRTVMKLSERDPEEPVGRFSGGQFNHRGNEGRDAVSLSASCRAGKLGCDVDRPLIMGASAVFCQHELNLESLEFRVPLCYPMPAHCSALCCRVQSALLNVNQCNTSVHFSAWTVELLHYSKTNK